MNNTFTITSNCFNTLKDDTKEMAYTLSCTFINTDKYVQIRLKS